MGKQARPITSAHRLGRGLSSLIGSSTLSAAVAAPHEEAPVVESAPVAGVIDPASPAGQKEIPIGSISPNPYQPRREFPAGELAELAASIAQDGVLQPLLVMPAANPAAAQPYVLVAGERRLRAAKLAGLTAVPCVVREATDRQLIEWSLIENIQRSDLNAVERAQAYRNYMDRFALTQAEVAERTGEARATVANYLRILELCDDVQKALLAGELTFGHTRALAGLAGQEQVQRNLAHRIVEQGLSVRQAEGLVAIAQRPAEAGSGATPRASHSKPPYVTDLEARLTQAVGTRVTIAPGRAKNTGRIVVEYYSLDDFDRIAAGLGLSAEA
jgi:ParB family chromosome partitioning protein